MKSDKSNIESCCEINKMINCAFNKWSMGFDENGNVAIQFNRHPIQGLITLSDASAEDLKNLGEMFLKEAIKYEELEQKQKFSLDKNLDSETLIRRRALLEMQRMSTKNLMALAVKAGIYDENGNLTKNYRDEQIERIE